MSYRNHVSEPSKQKVKRFILFLALLSLWHEIPLHAFEIFFQQVSCQNDLFSLDHCCFSLICKNRFLSVCSAKVSLSNWALRISHQHGHTRLAAPTLHHREPERKDFYSTASLVGLSSVTYFPSSSKCCMLSIFTFRQTKENFIQKIVENVPVPGKIFGVTQSSDSLPFALKGLVTFCCE